MNRQQRRRRARAAPGTDRAVLARPARSSKLDIKRSLERARDFVEAKKPMKALGICMEVLREHPMSAEVYFFAGTVAVRMGKVEEAEKLALAGISIQPRNAKGYVLLGWILYEANRPQEALEAIDKALALTPNDVDAMGRRAVFLDRVGRVTEALEQNERALAIEPDNPTLLRNEGGLLTDIGEFDRAGEYFKRALDVGNLDGRTVLGAVRANRFEMLGITADELEAMVSARDDQSIEVMGVYFALGDMADKSGDYDKAYRLYKTGNAIKASSIGDYELEKSFLRNRLQSRLFTRDVIDSFSGLGCDSRVPIFIIGMPRTGTTLVEQVLASHPDVFGADELTFVTENWKSVMPPDRLPVGPELFDYLKPHITRLGEKYVEQVRALAGNAPRVTDKMPGNWEALFLIRLMLPNAKVIYCRKHPLDTFMSLFKNTFAVGHLYTYHEHELAQALRIHLETMDAYRSVLGDWMHEVDYEDLVLNFEPVARGMVEFCDLDWNDRCLRYHETERNVRTSSNFQVRQKLYKTAINRWWNYEKYLGEIKEFLADYIAAYPSYDPGA